MPLTRDDVLRIAQAIPKTDLPREQVEVFGGQAFVRKLTVGERERLDTEIARDKGNIRVKWAIACLCDEQGNNLLSFDDLDRLASSTVPMADLDTVFLAALKLNSATDDTVEEAKKNS